jgi:hypothetical protein
MHLNKMGELQSNLNRMLVFSSCPIINSESEQDFGRGKAGVR